MAGELRVVTWNLQGSKGVDADAVAGVVADLEPDVLVLQEVQRGQARRLAQRCGLPHWRWAFKHWPVVSRPEGLAVLGAHRLSAAASFVVRPSWPWSWRRRIAIDATFVVDDRPYRCFDVHLSPPAEARGRTDEVDVLRDRAGGTLPIVAGDLNDRPGGATVDALRAAGWIDAWSATHGDLAAATGPGADDVDSGATNWTPGDRHGRRPTQRLDAVLVPAGWTVASCDVVDEPLDVLAELSDHLPLSAVVAPGGGRDVNAAPPDP